MEQNISQEARLYHNQGFNCAEAVIMALAKHYGINDSLVPKIATGFAGGIGHMGYTCGAILSAVVILNVIFGRTSLEETRKVVETYSQIQNLYRDFVARFGSADCLSIIGIDISTDDGVKQFKTSGKREKICAEIVAWVVDWVINNKNG